MNFARARLQFEILGLSAEDIAEDAGIAPYMVKDRAKEANWCTVWPSLGAEMLSDAGKVLDDSVMRLKVFNALLAIHLAPKYLELEVSLLDASIKAMKEDDLAPVTLAAIARVYTSLRNHASSSLISVDEIDLGMPKATIKNLSGKSLEVLEDAGVVPPGTFVPEESIL